MGPQASPLFKTACALLNRELRPKPSPADTAETLAIQLAEQEHLKRALAPPLLLGCDEEGLLSPAQAAELRRMLEEGLQTTSLKDDAKSLSELGNRNFALPPEVWQRISRCDARQDLDDAVTLLRHSAFSAARMTEAAGKEELPFEDAAEDTRKFGLPKSMHLLVTLQVKYLFCDLRTQRQIVSSWIFGWRYEGVDRLSATAADLTAQLLLADFIRGRDLSREVIVPCRVCARFFIARSKSAKTCSTACRQKLSRSEKSEEQKVESRRKDKVRKGLAPLKALPAATQRLDPKLAGDPRIQKLRAEQARQKSRRLP